MASKKANVYDEKSVKTLDWVSHIRHRPGMYIGKLGDGSDEDDGIYILLKEVIDNTLDEFMMGHGALVEIRVSETEAFVRDHGRGIPHKALVACVGTINTGAKYDDSVFERSIGMNGVGVKAVNALSDSFEVKSRRDGKTREAVFKRGKLKDERTVKDYDEAAWKGGTEVRFRPDPEIFGEIAFNSDFIYERLRLISFLNPGLRILFNDTEILSEEGLPELLGHFFKEEDMAFPPVTVEGDDVKLCFTYLKGSREREFSFVNGQFTREGGTHVHAFKESFIKIINEALGKNFDQQDIKNGLTFALAFRVQEPIFESQTKTKLGSTKIKIGDSHRLFKSFSMEKDAKAAKDHLMIPIKHVIDAELIRGLGPKIMNDKALCALIEQRIKSSEHERKEIQGLKKLAKSKEKEASFYNKKLRDSKYHQADKSKRGQDTMLFITEGDSAAGSITQVRDVETQAVFSLRGKPLNTLGVSRKMIFGNEELNLLQHAVGIDDVPEEVRYKKIIIATDADVDGMHIRLLLMTFFLQFYPRLVDSGQVYFLMTPLFRARKGAKVLGYFFSDAELEKFMSQKGAGDRKSTEITRFKGLGEISPHEMADFISIAGIKLVRLTAELHGKIIPGSKAVKPKAAGAKEKPADEATVSVLDILGFYMGKNTPERQKYIIDFLEQKA